jgi:hypothetical protein
MFRGLLLLDPEVLEMIEIDAHENSPLMSLF